MKCLAELPLAARWARTTGRHGSVARAVAHDGDHPVPHVTANPRTPDDVAPIAALFGVT
jgi:hypothetical protein